MLDVERKKDILDELLNQLAYFGITNAWIQVRGCMSVYRDFRHEKPTLVLDFGYFNIYIRYNEGRDVYEIESNYNKEPFQTIYSNDEVYCDTLKENIERVFLKINKLEVKHG